MATSFWLTFLILLSCPPLEVRHTPSSPRNGTEYIAWWMWEEIERFSGYPGCVLQQSRMTLSTWNYSVYSLESTVIKLDVLTNLLAHFNIPQVRYSDHDDCSTEKENKTRIVVVREIATLRVISEKSFFELCYRSRLRLLYSSSDSGRNETDYGEETKNEDSRFFVFCRTITVVSVESCAVESWHKQRIPIVSTVPFR